MNTLRVTKVLELAGVTDFRFVDAAALWRGSEVHAAIKLANRGTLDRRSIPKGYLGYFAAFERFKLECHFVPIDVEHEVEAPQIGLAGRFDATAYVRAKLMMVDFKTSSDITKATALQLALYGHMHDPATWWPRLAVRLGGDGKYRVKTFPIISWQADLATALACVRKAHGRSTPADEARIETWKKS
jgi:hypothetical protein